MSSATTDLLTDRLPDAVTLRDLGTHRLKDLGRPERVWQLCHPALPDGFAPLETLDASPNNLPAQLTTLVGRAAELAEVDARLQDHRLVTLTGAGGSGKTRLALQAAADATGRHRGGVWWVDLAPIRDHRLVPTAVLGALGLGEDHDHTVVETLAAEIRGRPTLLILDNCEHVIDGVTDLVRPLLEVVPNLRVLATSRELLGITGEVTWRVPSLTDDAAVSLFVERAQQVRPAFAPDAAQLVHVETICRRLDGLPLAVELAAARTRMMSPARIAAGLEDRFRLLSGGNRHALPRQQTLEASVAWSHDLLSEPERIVLRRLSVFAGTFSLDAAESVASDTETVDEFAVLDLLTALVDRSLVQVEDDDADTRYRLLETIRQFARERLVESGETDAVRTRHLDYFLALAEQAAPELVGPDGPRWLVSLEADHDNLRNALAWAEATPPDDAFARLALALTLFWELRGHMAEGHRWFDRVLARPATASSLRARTLWGAAHMAVYGDEFEDARTHATAAVAMAEECGDRWALARALNTIGFAQAIFEPALAPATLERSIAIGREIGDDWAVADGLKMLSIVYIFITDLDGLRPVRAELADVGASLGNLFFVGWAHAAAGFEALRRGLVEIARGELQQSLACCAQVGDPSTAGIAASWAADVEALAGDTAAARTQIERVLDKIRGAGRHISAPFASLDLLDLMVATGEAESARLLAAALVPEFTVPFLMVWTHLLAGAAANLLGDAAAAGAELDAALDACVEPDHHWLLGRLDRERATVARSEQRLGDAEQLLQDALARTSSAGLVPEVLTTLEALAGVASELESAAEGARLLGGTDAVRAELGLVRFPIEAAAVAADRARIEAALGPDEFLAAWNEGAATALDDLVAYASRARGERKRPSTGWESLTPTEERVVALVAEGLTNPQIGERMFIARGTVKVHLSHIFAKLGVATRAELAAAVTRRALDGARS